MNVDPRELVEWCDKQLDRLYKEHTADEDGCPSGRACPPFEHHYAAWFAVMEKGYNPLFHALATLRTKAMKAQQTEKVDLQTADA
jgi:hypothetical protein